MTACTKCFAPLGHKYYNADDFLHCPSCGSLLQVTVFPALLRETVPGTAGETLLMDDEANCFFHPQKKAVIPCDMCGRFLCALCDVEMNGQHLCLTCIEAGKKKKKIKNLENHRTIYDSIALSVSILSMLIWFITFITAPIVIYLVVRHWKTPSSIIPRTKIRFIAAFIIAGIQISGWAFAIYSMVTG